MLGHVTRIELHHVGPGLNSREVVHPVLVGHDIGPVLEENADPRDAAPVVAAAFEDSADNGRFAHKEVLGHQHRGRGRVGYRAERAAGHGRVDGLSEARPRAHLGHVGDDRLSRSNEIADA